MGKILLFTDHSISHTNDEQFNFDKEYETIDQYPTDNSLTNNQIFVRKFEFYAILLFFL